MCELDRSANRTPRFTVRALKESETDAALRLVWNVFMEFEAPDYAREGVDEFQKCLNDAGFLAGIRYYGAFCEENLIGVLGVRKLVAHVCFLFVDGAYHRRDDFQTRVRIGPIRAFRPLSRPSGIRLRSSRRGARRSDFRGTRADSSSGSAPAAF